MSFCLCASISVLLFVLTACDGSPEDNKPTGTAIPGVSAPEAEAFPVEPLARKFEANGSPEGNKPTGTAKPGVSAPEAEAFPLEPLARQFESKWLVPFWDQLRSRPNQLDAFPEGMSGSVPFVGFGARSERSHDMVDIDLIPDETADIGSRIAEWRKQGVKVGHSDWHQESIRRVGAEIESVVRCNIHAVQGDRRIRIKGRFAVNWSLERPDRPKSIRWLKGTLTERIGEAAFTKLKAMGVSSRNPQGRGILLGLAVYDLNADARPDIAIATANARFMNRGGFQFEARPLSSALVENNETLQTLVFGDFDGDGVVDFVGSQTDGELIFLRGNGNGAFPGVPQPILGNGLLFDKLTCLTAGDVDGDHDLDLFGGQWIAPHERMPSSYWNALDGPPNLLLRNDGKGRFTDITEAAGLKKKAGRRTYSASLLDLDDDLDLDLLVVSDFSGVDIYLNDGIGRFEDVTDAWLPPLEQRASFGMSHAIADLNLDGRLDLFVTGMGSTTVRRLELMQGVENDPMRSPMGYGNRLFLRRDLPGYAASPFAHAVARTGWSWGSSAFDFDNDSDLDLYVANGHISGETANDYGSHFWCSDLRQSERPQKLGGANPQLDRIAGLQTMSWDGFQPNALLLNHGESGFSEAGHLLDLGYPHDARCLVTADLNRDGWVDVVLTTAGGTTGFEHVDRAGHARPTCEIIRNTGWFGEGNRWIGLQLDADPERNPHGARIDVYAIENDRERRYSKVVVSGDSFSSQHPAEAHFGLGQATRVDRIEITWPGGKKDTMRSPPINDWYVFGTSRR